MNTMSPAQVAAVIVQTSAGVASSSGVQLPSPPRTPRTPHTPLMQQLIASEHECAHCGSESSVDSDYPSLFTTPTYSSAVDSEFSDAESERPLDSEGEEEEEQEEEEKKEKEKEKETEEEEEEAPISMVFEHSLNSFLKI